MPLSDEDIDRIANAVWAKTIDTTPAGAEIEPQPARYWLQRTFLIVREYLGGVPRPTRRRPDHAQRDPQRGDPQCWLTSSPERRTGPT